MKHRLTHEVLHYLKSNGYTILVGMEMTPKIGAAKKSEYIFTPVEWDVEEFKKESEIEEYNRHTFYLIDDLLNIDLNNLYTHRVVMIDG